MSALSTEELRRDESDTLAADRLTRGEFEPSDEYLARLSEARERMRRLGIVPIDRRASRGN